MRGILGRPTVPVVSGAHTSLMAAGLGTISGQVTKGGSPLASAGKIQLLSDADGSLIATATVDGSGNYSFGGLSNPNYRLRPQPGLPYCTGASETTAQDPTAYDVVALNATKNFVFADAHWYDDLERYADTAALANASTGIFTDQSMDRAGNPFHAAITLETIGGKKAMRYNFPNNDGDCGTYTQRAIGRKNAGVGPTSSTRWIKWRGTLSNPWSNTDVDCGESGEYKFLNFQIASGGPVVALLFFGGHTGNPNHVLTFTIGNGTNSWSNAQQTPTGQHSVGNSSAAFFGAPHDFLIHLLRFDGSSTNWEAHLWIDEVKQLSLLGVNAAIPFACQNGWTGIELGANINAGPAQTQTRDWFEMSVSDTRPAMRQTY